MKKNRFQVTIILIAIVLLVLNIVFYAVRFTVGNRQLFDVTKSFSYGIIILPNGKIVEGKVSSWLDFEDGDQIQVKIGEETYLTHISNVVLMSE